jgi:Flp pilus assembly protein TadG
MQSEWRLTPRADRRLTRTVDWRLTRWAGNRDRGSMAVEMVIAAPALVLLMLLIAGGGQWIDLAGRVGAAARDAARAASVARTLEAADSGAQSAAQADLAGVCADGGPTVTVQPVGGSFADTGPGVQAAPDVRVDVSCVANLSAFKAIGFNVHQTFSDSATVPLDPFMERTG